MSPEAIDEREGAFVRDVITDDDRYAAGKRGFAGECCYGARLVVAARPDFAVQVPGYYDKIAANFTDRGSHSSRHVVSEVRRVALVQCQRQAPVFESRTRVGSRP